MPLLSAIFHNLIKIYYNPDCPVTVRNPKYGMSLSRTATDIFFYGSLCKWKFKFCWWSFWAKFKFIGGRLVHNAHPLLALIISRKKLVRVYNAHGLLKKIVVGNVRIKYQSYIFSLFSYLSKVNITNKYKTKLH
jgi:hypothetical protein